MKIHIEVVWALPRRQRVVSVALEKGATAAEAAKASGLGVGYCALGRHGERIGPDTVLEEGDRLELLRPLAADPKDARRRRARRNSV